MQSTSAISSQANTVMPQQATNIATINPPNAALKLSGAAGGSPGTKKSTTNPPLGRGVPPPIPPNKPVIPPKREGSSSRLVTGAANGSKEGALPPTAVAGDISNPQTGASDTVVGNE